MSKAVLVAAVGLLFRLALLALVLSPPRLKVSAENALTLSPQELVVFEGGDATLSCSPYLPVEPPILIQQDHIIFKTSTEPRFSFEDCEVLGDPFLSKRIYTLRGVTREDDRTRFRCVIGDVQSEEVTLMVYVSPELTGPSGRQYLMEGSPRVDFSYKETLGLPPPHSFTWLLNGLSFHGNSRIQLLNNNSTLSVRFVSRADSGNYTLTVASGSGNASLELDLVVTYDEFTVVPESSTVEEGEIVTLTCGHRFGQTYDWVTTDREPISTLGNKVSVRNGGRTLDYGPVSYNDHLLSVMCVVSSVDEVNFFESTPATLSVRAPPRVNAPVAMSAIEGRDEEVILPFTVHSFPPSLSQLYMHNDVPLATSAKVTTLAGGFLLIRNPDRNDAGQYMLTVANSRGTDSAVVTLEIFYSPQLSALPGPLVAQHMKATTIPCGTRTEVTGHPLPAYQWARRDVSAWGSMLPARFHVNTTSGELMLRTAMYTDAGVYICTASNSIGDSTILVTLLVKDPPGPPMGAMALPVGRTWAHISWLPPSNGADIGAISSYRVTAVPRPFPDSSTASESLVNSSCVESECETRRKDVPGTEMAVNLTDLVPGVHYSLTLIAFSNGSSLQSSPSELLSFTTVAYVPGVGSVSAAVNGPGSANVSWTLAYSGGLPVQRFFVEYRRNDMPIWRRVQAESVELQIANFSILPERRYHIVRSLESQELYEFRVAASNELGMGEFQRTSERLLSHEIGIPSPPSKPRITSWKDGCATIAANLSKFGSRQDFLLGYVLILNHTDVLTVTGIDFQGSYVPGEEVEITVANVSYRGDWRFAVLASNYLGPSLPSEPSLPATVGIALWAAMSAANIVVLAASAIVCRLMSWESKKQKRGLARRLQMAARDQTECPISPRSLCTFGDIGSSPDGRSNNLMPMTAKSGSSAMALEEQDAGTSSFFPLSMV